MAVFLWIIVNGCVGAMPGREPAIIHGYRAEKSRACRATADSLRSTVAVYSGVRVYAAHNLGCDLHLFIRHMRPPLPSAGAVLLLIDLQQAIDHPSWGERNNPHAETQVSRLLAYWRSRGGPGCHIRP